MRGITIGEMERDFDGVLDAVEQGEIVLILRDDVPVIRMEPVRPSSPENAR